MDRWSLTAKHILVHDYSVSSITPEYKQYICSKSSRHMGTEHNLLHFTLVSGKCWSSTDNDLSTEMEMRGLSSAEFLRRLAEGCSQEEWQAVASKHLRTGTGSRSQMSGRG